MMKLLMIMMMFLMMFLLLLMMMVLNDDNADNPKFKAYGHNSGGQLFCNLPAQIKDVI